MNLSKLLLLLVFFISTAVRAQEGGSSFDFLNLPTSSHISALGGNNISIIEEDVMVANQNPALLGQEMDLQLGLNFMNYVAGIKMGGVSFAKAAGERGAFAVGMQYLGYGKMDQTEPDGTIVGSFSPKDMVVNGMYSHDITDRLRGGINVKFLYSSFEQYTSLAMAVDLGINYYIKESDLSLSLVVKNLGGQLKRYNDKAERMPWDIQLGLSKSLDHAPIRFSVTAQYLTRWNLPYTTLKSGASTSDEQMETTNSFVSNLFRHLVFGVEYIPSSNVYVALGYNYKARSDMKSYGRNFLSGFGIGAGVKVKMFGIGASFTQQHVGGSSFMLNLTANLADFL